MSSGIIVSSSTRAAARVLRQRSATARVLGNQWSQQMHGPGCVCGTCGRSALHTHVHTHGSNCNCTHCGNQRTRAVSSSALNASQTPSVYHGPSCGCGKCGGKPIAERDLSLAATATNRGVVFMGPNHVEVQGIPFPKLELDSTSSPVKSERQKRKCNHGAILKVVSTNICGSDQHMVRGRTSLPGGHMVLGHEITGEVIELGSDCETLEIGDICSVPFNIACGRCAACKRGDTGVCLRTNPARPGAAYGYVDMGGWVGGQAEYVMVPYADFNLLKFPDRAQAMEKIRDLTLLSDIFPTGFHGAVQAGVKPGSIVYVAGAGPVGLASAVGCQLLGAACVIVGDMIPERLQQAASFGCETIDLRQEGTLKDHIAQLIPSTGGIVDGAVDCVGFEARGTGAASTGEVPAQVLNDCMDIVREGGRIGIPGLYVTEDPGGVDEAAQIGSLSLRLGLGWSKSHYFGTGQCPVMTYHHQLMQTILFDKVKIADAVNVKVISLDDAPQGYAEFDSGASVKFVLDPHGVIDSPAFAKM